MKKLLLALFIFFLPSCAHSGFGQKVLVEHLSSVVKIEVSTHSTDKLTGAEKGGAWTGTGFSIQANESETYLLTNKHMCLPEGAIADNYVIITSTGKKYEAKFVRVDRNADLCLLKTAAFIPQLSVAKENPLKGEKVMTIGAPEGIFPYFSDGFIMGYKIINTEDMAGHDIKLAMRAMMLTAPIYGGSSGSPIINDKGLVVGIIFAGFNGSDHLNLMVPASLILEFLDTTQNVY